VASQAFLQPVVVSSNSLGLIHGMLGGRCSAKSNRFVRSLTSLGQTNVPASTWSKVHVDKLDSVKILSSREVRNGVVAACVNLRPASERHMASNSGLVFDSMHISGLMDVVRSCG